MDLGSDTMEDFELAKDSTMAENNSCSCNKERDTEREREREREISKLRYF